MTRFGLLVAFWLVVIAGWLLWVGHANDDLARGRGVVRLREASIEITSLSPARRDVVLESAITLPLHFDVQYEGTSGSATIRVPLSLDVAADFAAKGVLIERIGAAFEIALNGHVLATGGRLDEADRFYAKAPVHLLLPARLLAADGNELVFRLRADTGDRAGLSPPLLGSPEAIDALARQARGWRVDLPLAASTFSLVVGAFCLLLWWQHRDPLYAWAGVGELLWVTQASAPLVSAAMLLTQGTQALLYGYGITLSIWVLVLVRLAFRWHRQATVERAIVWGALVMALVASTRDIWAARFSVEAYAESAWAKYLAPLVGLALMWIVAQRFRNARESVLEMNATLTDRIQQKEAEPRNSFARLAEVERSRAVLSERQRILRDMHDGVGAHLATPVRQLEGGQASGKEVARSLRDSLMQLKLSIDAMSLPRGDVNALMASLRFRLESRIAQAGIALRWKVDALPMWRAPAGRGDDAMRDLQFVLLEAISNVLQHANACRRRRGQAPNS